MTPDPPYALTDDADADLDRILTESGRRFGAAQRDRYTVLIRAAILKVAAMPERPGSRDWSDLEQGLRSYHVALAARRRGAAVHILFYKRADGGVLIVRILHDAMDFARHLGPEEGAPQRS